MAVEQQIFNTRIQPLEPNLLEDDYEPGKEKNSRVRSARNAAQMPYSPLQIRCRSLMPYSHLQSSLIQNNKNPQASVMNNKVYHVATKKLTSSRK